MKYIKVFNTVSAYTEKRENDYLEPWVSYTKENEVVNYNKSEYEKLLSTPLTFEITGDGVIRWKSQDTGYTKTIEYKKNDGEWTEIVSTTAGTPISVVSGDTIQFRGDNLTYATGTSKYNSFSGTTAGFNISGNIMSLISSSGFATLNVLTSSYTFNYLMCDCTGLTDASKLVLPATTLIDNCYRYMFDGCTSLTTAPELPATTLASNCYNGMFSGCTSLNYIKAMFTTTPGPSYTSDWVSSVASTGTFVKNSAATWTTRGVNGIPTDWTVETASA